MCLFDILRSASFTGWFAEILLVFWCIISTVVHIFCRRLCCRILLGRWKDTGFRRMKWVIFSRPSKAPKMPPLFAKIFTVGRSISFAAVNFGTFGDSNQWGCFLKKSRVKVLRWRNFLTIPCSLWSSTSPLLERDQSGVASSFWAEFLVRSVSLAGRTFWRTTHPFCSTTVWCGGEPCALPGFLPKKGIKTF